MRIVQHEGIPDCPSLRNQWNALVQAMGRPQVFYTFEWARAVALGYAGSLKPLILAAYREEKLVGVVALARDARSKQVSFLAASTADYCDFISELSDREAFVESAMRELQHIGVAHISLANLPADSLSAHVLRSVTQRLGYAVFARPAYVCAQVPLDSEYKRTQTRKSARNKMRRLSNAAAEHGEFVVRHSNQWEELTNEFPDFATAHVQRFLANGRVSNLVSPERRAFLLELGRSLSEQDWLTLSSLKLAGRTIAWNYGFRFARNWFWYQPAFDRDMAHLSPGTYLLCEILRRASDDPQIRTVDLGLGDEEYKERYSKAGRLTLHITACSRRRKLVEVCRYRAAELVKCSSGLERGIRACTAKMQSVHGRITKTGVAGALKLSASRAANLLMGAREVLFFERTASQLPSSDLSLQLLSLKLLATAAMEYSADGQTLDYILRAADRLNSNSAEGFALTTSTQLPVHFCWVSRFEGFRIAELRQVLKEPVAGSVLLFDCWTPPSQRSHGYYSSCIAKVAGQMLERGKRPWIFSAASNTNSLRGIERAGFVPRFSLKQRNILLVTTLSKINLTESNCPRMDLYPAA